MSYEQIKAILYLIIWGYAGVVMICDIIALFCYNACKKVFEGDLFSQLFFESDVSYDISFLIYTLWIATALFILYLIMGEYRYIFTFVTIINTGLMYKHLTRAMRRMKAVYED